MSSELQLDVCHLNRWMRHLVNAYEIKTGMVLLVGLTVDPCLSSLKWFVHHVMHHTSAVLYLLRFRLICNCKHSPHRSPTSSGHLRLGNALAIIGGEGTAFPCVP